jgi:hypothetical protein
MSVINNIFDVVNQAPKKNFGALVNRASQSNINSNTSYDNMYSNGFIFNQYSNLTTAFEIIQEIRAKQNRELFENRALSYVEDYSNYEDFMRQMNAETNSFRRLKDFVRKTSENLKSIVNLGGSIKNDRIKITQDDRGVFDFSLASQGLYRPVEYYSSDFQKKITQTGINPFEYLGLEKGVIPPEKVKKDINGVFVFEQKGQLFECERRQSGTTKVFNTFFDLCFLKTNPQGLFLPYLKSNKDKVFNGEGDVRLKYASSNKKSFLIYEKKNDNVKYVDIFVPINYVSVNDPSRAIAMLPAFLIALFLRDYGVQTRISAMRLGSDRSTHTTVSIAVKDYDDDIENAFDYVFNILSRQSVAGSFFAFFKVYCSNLGLQANPTRDMGANFDDVKYNLQDYINNMMNRYKNWIVVNKDKPFVNTRVTNPNFQFGIATTGYDISSGYGNINDILNNIHNIFFKFYYYIDFLSIEMLSIQEFVKNLYQRVNEDTFFKKLYTMPSDKKSMIEIIKTYVITILVEKYSIVEGGEYADTAEQKENKQKLFTEKVLLLNESLNSL